MVTVLALLVGTPSDGSAETARGSDTVRVVVLLPSDSTLSVDFRRGVELGTAEGVVLARLFGRALVTDMVFAGDSIPLDVRAMPAADRSVSAMIAFLDSAATARLAVRLESLETPLLNAGSSADALRGEQCSAALFHVAPSAAMLRDARRMTADDARGGARIQAWHGRLERYGAGELNDRYRSRFGLDATDDAWLGWVALKIIVEAALRSESAEGRDVLAQLRREARFDGHKGKPLTFRSWDGQLRQPLYAVSGAADASLRVVELPGDAADPEAAAADVLDQLGHRAESTSCSKKP